MMEDTRAHLLPLTWQFSKVVLLHGCEDDDRKMKIGRLACWDTGGARSRRSALQIYLPSRQPAMPSSGLPPSDLLAFPSASSALIRLPPSDMRIGRAINGGPEHPQCPHIRS